MTLIYLTFAWLAGIVVSHLLWSRGLIGPGMSVWWIALPVFGSAATTGLCRIRRSARCGLAALLLTVALCGATRYLLHPLYPTLTSADLAWYHSEDEPLWTTVDGVVVGYPDVRDQTTQYRLLVDTLVQDEATVEVNGFLLVIAPRYPEYQYGDRLRISGQIRTPDRLEGFDYRAYLARREIYSIVRRPAIELLASSGGVRGWSALYRFRAHASTVLNRLLPEPAAALANGILLGIESGIPEDLSAAFEATGTTHVIVISGSNIALFSGLLLTLLARVLGRLRATAPTIAAIVLYVLLAGADASAVRAGWMGVLYVLAIALGRQNTAIVSLFASALMMTGINPLALWDVGFQLSFAATFGLIFFARPIRALLQRAGGWLTIGTGVRPGYELVCDMLAVTLAAQVMTLPITMLHFGRLSLVSLFANLLIGPVQPLIMVGGLSALGLGLLWELPGRLVAFIPWLFISYMTAVVNATAQIPLAAVDTESYGRIAAAAYYGILVALFATRRLIERLGLRLAGRRVMVGGLVAGLSLVVVGSAIAARPDGLLHLYYVPSEYGEGVLLLDPGGRCVALDDGSGGEWLAGVSGDRPCRLGRPGDLWVGTALPEGWEKATLVSTAVVEAGTGLRGDHGMQMELLQFGQDPFWLLSYGQFRTLLPSLLSRGAQNGTGAEQALSLTLLKTPGSASGSWPTTEFLGSISAEVFLWPEDTSYPPETAQALRALSAVRVPSDALLEVATDGTRFWMQSRGTTEIP